MNGELVWLGRHSLAYLCPINPGKDFKSQIESLKQECIQTCIEALLTTLKHRGMTACYQFEVVVSIQDVLYAGFIVGVASDMWRVRVPQDQLVRSLCLLDYVGFVSFNTESKEYFIELPVSVMETLDRVYIAYWIDLAKRFNTDYEPLMLPSEVTINACVLKQ